MQDISLRRRGYRGQELCMFYQATIKEEEVSSPSRKSYKLLILRMVAEIQEYSSVFRSKTCSNRLVLRCLTRNSTTSTKKRRTLRGVWRWYWCYNQYWRNESLREDASRLKQRRCAFTNSAIYSKTHWITGECCSLIFEEVWEERNYYSASWNM